MSSGPESPKRGASSTPRVLDGIAGSPGLAIGRAIVIDVKRPGFAQRRIRKHAADDEIERFDRAVEQAAEELRDVAERVGKSAARAEASILEAYVMMVRDDLLREEVERHIRIDLQCAEWAVHGAVSEMARQLRGSGDPYLAERSHDFGFVGDRLLKSLSGRHQMHSMPVLDEPSILVARDLSPAETAVLRKDQVLAMVTEVGTRTSHTAILARALEIPAVVGVRGILRAVGSGDQLVVDGLRGRVTLAPTDEILSAASARARKHEALAGRLHELRDRPARTRCGVEITLRGNIELPAETSIALGEGASGIGLYRTEFLYVNRSDLPSEDEQYEVYKSVLELAAPMPVTLRTFDIGGDKFSSAFHAPPEMNPALGLRAVRLGLAHPEIFSTQLRAMVRASAHGDVRMMIPMVSALRELRDVRTLLEQAQRDVERAGHASADHIPLGVMIEVPSAAIMADAIAREAEFMSIGTNDLVQYALAVDRTSSEMVYLASPLDPAILRLIRGVVDAGQKHARPVAVCGAMGSDPLAVILLVGMGLRELSMEASAIPEVKEALSRVRLSEAREVAAECLHCVDAEDVFRTLNAAFAKRFSDLRGEDGSESGSWRLVEPE